MANSLFACVTTSIIIMLVQQQATTYGAPTDSAAADNSHNKPDDPVTSGLTPSPTMQAILAEMRVMMLMSPVVDALCEVDQRKEFHDPKTPSNCWLCLRGCRVDSPCFAQCRNKTNAVDWQRLDMDSPVTKNVECQDLNRCYNNSCPSSMLLSQVPPGDAPPHISIIRNMLGDQLKCIQTSCADQIAACLNSDGVKDVCQKRGCVLSCGSDCRTQCSKECAP